MIAGFDETVLGGVLIAPFVRYARCAFAIYVLSLRPLLRCLPMRRFFANPPLVGACIYVTVLAALLVLAGGSDR